MSIGSEQHARNDERLAMLSALVNGDVQLAYRLVLELLANGMSFDAIVVEVLAPVQEDVGRRWAAGELGIADEHAASVAVDELLVRLGATAETPEGPAIVVASAEHDHHALGGRVVASALALAGYRVMILGASIPAVDLADFLEMQQPLALALSCSIPTARAGAARSIAAAHELAIPVVGGGRALTTHERATRLGFDALARLPGDAVEILRSWEHAPPNQLLVAPDPIPELAAITAQHHTLVAMAINATTIAGATPTALIEEVERVLQVIGSAMLVQESALIADHVQWLRETGPAHGFERTVIDSALAGLANAMRGELQPASAALRLALGDHQ